MVEELQRSVAFFSRANSTLKQQHNELTQYATTGANSSEECYDRGIIQYKVIQI
jgi:hypothetical protein